jgi:hypothetical protein
VGPGRMRSLVGMCVRAREECSREDCDVMEKSARLVMHAACVRVREWSAVEKTACSCANGVQFSTFVVKVGEWRVREAGGGTVWENGRSH